MTVVSLDLKEQGYVCVTKTETCEDKWLLDVLEHHLEAFSKSALPRSQQLNSFLRCPMIVQSQCCNAASIHLNGCQQQVCSKSAKRRRRQRAKKKMMRCLERERDTEGECPSTVETAIVEDACPGGNLIVDAMCNSVGKAHAEEGTQDSVSQTSNAVPFTSSWEHSPLKTAVLQGVCFLYREKP